MNFSNTVTPSPRAIAVMLGALALVLAAAAMAFAFGDHQRVTLDVDGVKVSQLTSAKTVDELLAENDVVVGEDDLVTSAGPTLSSGDTVTVRTAKPVTLVVDGDSSQSISHALTVDEFLRTEKVRVAGGAFLSDEREDALDPEGNLIVVSNPKDITLEVDGQQIEVVSAAATVETFLAAHDVELGTLDEVSQAMWTYLTPGTDLKVTRIEKVTRTEEIPVDFKVEITRDNSMLKSQKKVTQAGQRGLDSAEVELVLADGEVRERTIISRTSIRPAIVQKESHGTKNPSNIDGGSNNVSGGVWDRLARCESGGNWQINTGNGYYGGLQFSAATWRSVGGSGLPHQNSKAEQIKRGKILQARAGWGQWPACTKKLGLR